MGFDPRKRDEADAAVSDAPPAHGGGVVFGVIVIALIAAIGFFYITENKRDNRQAEMVTNAAQSVDETVKVVGKAAKDAADTLRNEN